MGNWVRTKAPKLTDGITTEKMAHHQAFKYSIKMLSCQLTKLNRMWLAITSAWFLWANMGNRFAAWTFAAMIESIENLSSRREWDGGRGFWRRGISLCQERGRWDPLMFRCPMKHNISGQQVMIFLQTASQLPIVGPVGFLRLCCKHRNKKSGRN